MSTEFVFVYGTQISELSLRPVEANIFGHWIRGHVVKRGMVDDYRFYSEQMLCDQKWNGQTILDSYKNYVRLGEGIEIREIPKPSGIIGYFKSLI